MAVRYWLLVAFVGGLIALMASMVNISEIVIFDYKYGFCKSGHILWS